VSDRKTFVIVGAGLAGAKAAETLREEGFDGRVVLVADEARLPYERPPLSKSYLAGDSTFADAQVHDDGFYSDHGIELLTSMRAAALDPSAQRVLLSDGHELRYDRLLIATGAVPRRPPIEGAHGDGVHVLRTVADADALRAALGAGARLLVIGAGWIGCEAAATARGLGAEVTVIEHATVPLERVLGRRLGAFFAGLHRSHGVELLTSAGVESIDDAGRRVRLSGGRTINADAVLIGVGVAPATALAEAAGIDVDNGIVVDEHLRTSAPDVFAAGDVASAFHPTYARHVRVEHWDNAQAQGAAAARAMLGIGGSYTKLPYFFSDQYDLGMEYVGLHDPDDELVIRGSLDDGRFQAFWIGADGSVSAAMHVNDWDAIDPIRAIVEARAKPDPRRSSDPDRPLAHDRQPA
jgi:3-phenylpropionate/trans-cinnamate dioxygenase ferredoxin reductase component